jgi:hypothetical protein
MILSILSMRLKMGFSMEIPFLYPNCSGIKIPFTCKCWFSVSRIFENDINNEIGL